MPPSSRAWRRLRGKDDLLLIAGKGHETGQTIKGVTHHFDDAEVAREFAGGGDVSALWTSDEVARASGAGHDQRAVRGQRRHVRQPRRRPRRPVLCLERRDHRRPRFRRRGVEARRRGCRGLARCRGRGRHADPRARHDEGAGRASAAPAVAAARPGSRASPARSARPAPRTRCAPCSAAQAPTSASAASFNNHVGVPISLARLPREARYGVFEIGMNHPGEIEPLARQVEAHVGVITNVGPVHIGHMGSEEAIADEKGCLFAGMAEGAVAVLNRDSRHYDRLVGHARRFGVSRIVGFGRSEAAEARLLSCSLQDSGSDVVALIHGRRIEYRLGAAGEHWVLNSIAALAVVEALGADVVEAAATLRGHRCSPGRGARRMLKFGAGTVELLDESYNANPVSMRAMLAVAGAHRARPGGRRAAGDGRHARAGRGGGCLSCRARRRGGGERRGAGLPVRPAHAGAVAAAGAGAARRAPAGLGVARAATSRRRCGQAT